MNIILRKILGRSKELDDYIKQMELEKEKNLTKRQKIKRKIKKGIWNGVKLYLASYLLSTAVVGCDYFFYRRPQIIQRSQTENKLDMRKYIINIGGQKKHLTLVGETHFYSALENKIARELAQENASFASECGKNASELTLGNEIYVSLLGVPLLFSTPFYRLGSGRWHDSVSDEADALGKKVDALEDENAPFENLSAQRKISMFACFLWSGLTGPYQYYTEIYKENKPDKERINSFKYRKELIDDRDPIIAKSIIRLLEKDDVKKLVANVGRWHVPGIVAYLAEHADIKEINN